MSNRLGSVDVEMLYVGTIGVKPVSIDWRELDVDNWTYTEGKTDFEFSTDQTFRIVSRNGTLAAVHVEDTLYEEHEYDDYLANQGWDHYADYLDSLGEDEVPDLLDEREWRDLFQQDVYAEGPMMNSWYPYDLRGGDLEIANAIAHLPLCVVTVDGNTGLALTGGGMDLSWEICEAFILAGYLPPAHFADLPGMAGRGESDDDRVIIAACRRTFQSVINGAQHSLDALQRRYPDQPKENA